MISSNAEGQRHSAAMTEGGDGISREQVRGAAGVTGRMGPSPGRRLGRDGAVVERENMRTAAKRVRSNKGVPGVDGMRVEDVWGYYGPHIEKSVLDGSYEPQWACGARSPSLEAVPGNWASLRPWIVWSNRRCTRCSRRSSIPASPTQATGSVPVEARIQAAEGREHVAAGENDEVDMDQSRA